MKKTSTYSGGNAQDRKQRRRELLRAGEAVQEWLEPNPNRDEERIVVVATVIASAKLVGAKPVVKPARKEDHHPTPQSTALNATFLRQQQSASLPVKPAHEKPARDGVLRRILKGIQRIRPVFASAMRMG